MCVFASDVLSNDAEMFASDVLSNDAEMFASDVLSNDSKSDSALSNELDVQENKDYYPLTDRGLEDRINNALDTIKINKSNLFSIDNGMQKWQIIRKKIYDATRPFIKDGDKIKDFLHFSEYKAIFDPFDREHILKAVLIVAIKFNRRPEQILTLWQIEGLPEFIGKEDKQPSKVWDAIYGLETLNKFQALACARSDVLYQRWGLDVFMPHVKVRGKDNDPTKTVDVKIHDNAFNEAYEKIKDILPVNPILYLSSGKPIQVKINKESNDTYTVQYRTLPEYQTTMLALQQAQFKKIRDTIPVEFNNISLLQLSSFPALNYLYFNSKYPETSLVIMAEGMKTYYGKNKDDSGEDVKKEFTIEDLHKAFTSIPVPEEVKNYLQNSTNGHGYMNALRFEFLWQIYSEAFKGVLVEIDDFADSM